MQLSPDQARSALQEAEAIRQRSSKLHSYLLSSPYLLLWGVIWILAFLLNQWLPERSGLIWMVLDIIGFAIGLGIALNRTDRSRYVLVGRRYAGIGLTLFGFFVASFFILRPNSPEQATAFIALTFAVMYIIGGLYAERMRTAIIGVMLVAVILSGYLLLQTYFFIWMSLAGGGLLVAAGFWFKGV
jgi:hypothetical protein